MILEQNRTVVVRRPASLTVTAERPSARSLVVLARGMAGRNGTEGGGGAAFVGIAATTLSGHRVVRAVPVDRVGYASSASTAAATADVWLTKTAASAGAEVELHAFGELYEPSWSWTEGVSVYLGVDGVLTQTPPTVGVLRQVATVLDARTLFFNPRPGTVLA